ncbi:MAG TPA: cytochrome oxidase small assembly protein [Burkholderiales bacterium]|nr:cytochrome oxidase small assembly protein [Burkholderiales bacterium]
MSPSAMTDEQKRDVLRRKNLRTGLALGALALAFFIGFFVKMGVFQ